MAFSSSSSSSWVSQLAVKATVLAAVCLLLHGGGGSGASAAELCVGHYDHTCPDAYKIVQGVLVEAHKSDPRIFASLIRLHFHDCFVLGCDGSLLLDTFPGFQSEKDRAPQQQLGARLPGAHTFGRVKCRFVTDRLYNFSGTNQPDPTLNPAYRSFLSTRCPRNGDANSLNDLDQTTPNTFDKNYFTNLEANPRLS
ncbi:hypothetical protein ACQ4PT_058664 [Festuca glaucescens]